jgi:outer membrane lipoprotein-sorting protein
MRTAVLLAVPVLVLAASSTSAAPDLTAAQVIARSRQAYRSLKSYRGASRVVTHSTITGARATYNTRATVEFVRPGKLRVEGTMMAGGEPFAFVSDGATTWQTALGKPGVWERAQSTEMAIAAFNGVSQNAATTIPAMLVEARWGDLYGTLRPRRMVREKLNGRAAYRIEAAGPTGPATLWIDRKTSLLCKVRRRHDLARMSGLAAQAAGAAAQALPASGALNVTETFTGVRTNVSIPAARFVRPEDAAPSAVDRSDVQPQQPAPDSGVDALTPGVRPSQHFLQRAQERGVPADVVYDVLRSGRRFYDPKHDSLIRWKDGVYVALTASGVLKTVIRGPIERRWRPE